MTFESPLVILLESSAASDGNVELWGQAEHAALKTDPDGSNLKLCPLGTNQPAFPTNQREKGFFVEILLMCMFEFRAGSGGMKASWQQQGRAWKGLIGTALLYSL